MVQAEERRVSTHNVGGRKKSCQLPFDIIHDILSRLPTVSILRFRSVCKSWDHLSRDPAFIKMQLERTIDQPYQAILQEDYGFDFVLLDVESQKSVNIPFEQLKLPDDFEFELSDLDVVCACNGLLCLAPKYWMNPVLICNPVTGDSVILPPSSRSRDKYIDYQLGFQFDVLSGKYKVVREYRLENDKFSRFEIITVGESTWRELSAPNCVVECEFTGAKFWNGSFYWKINAEGWSHEENIDNIFLLAFDLSNEEFYNIPFPYHYMLALIDAKLLVFGGYLNLVECEPRLMSIWRVMGNKVEGFSVCLQHSFRLRVPRNYHSGYDLICQLCEGVFLLQIFRREQVAMKCFLMKFSPEEVRFLINVNVPGISDLFSTVCFKPTLVSPLEASSI